MIKVFYHDDLDGLAAAAVILSVFPEADFKSVNYGDTITAKDVEGCEAWIVDFSVDNLLELNEAATHLIWIDHHVTAMNTHEDVWSDVHKIHGLREIGYSGALLTWRYLIADTVPLVIEAVDTCDVWKFDGSEAKEMHRAIGEFLNAKMYGPDDPVWEAMFDTDALMANAASAGKLLLEAKEQRIAGIIDRGQEIDYEGYNAFICNATSDVSLTGNTLCEVGYDIAIMYNIVDGKVRLSFRSIDYNVREIAERLGGGGHDLAAGATVELETLFEMIR